MADEQYQIGIDVQKTGSGDSDTVRGLDSVKAAAGETAAALNAIPPKIVDTQQFKDLAAGASEAEIKLSTMRSTMSGLQMAASGSAIGLARAVEGIAKMSGASDAAIAKISALNAQLAAAAIGGGIGWTLGTIFDENIVQPLEKGKSLLETFKGILGDDVKQTFQQIFAPEMPNAFYEAEKNAYEAAAKVRKELIATNSQKLREVITEIDGVKRALTESEDQAKKTKQAMDILNEAQSQLESANIKKKEAAGEISPLESKALQDEIVYRRELNKLLEEQATAQKELEKIAVDLEKGGTGSAAYRDQEAMVSAAKTNVQTAQTNRQAELIELGGESRKVLQDLEAAIKAQEMKVQTAREAVAPAARSGDNALLVGAQANVQEQEAILATLKSQFARIGSTMREALNAVGSSLSEAGASAAGKITAAGVKVKADLDQAAANVEKDTTGAAKVATDAMTSANGQVAGALMQSGQAIANAINGFQGKIISTFSQFAQDITARISDLDRAIQRTDAKSTLALSQIKNGR